LALTASSEPHVPATQQLGQKVIARSVPVAQSVHRSIPSATRPHLLAWLSLEMSGSAQGTLAPGALGRVARPRAHLLPTVSQRQLIGRPTPGRRLPAISDCMSLHKRGDSPSM
jgi:hypothetical protein